MWPTFYIPSGASFPFVSGEAVNTCGQITATTTPNTIPNPTGIADGDTQLLIVTYFRTGDVNWPSGWRLVFDAGRTARPSGVDYGLYEQRIYVRKYQTGDPLFTVSTVSGLVDVLYANVILQNPEASDPWFNACWAAPTALPYGGGAPEGPMQYLECANQGDLIIQCSASSTGLTALTNEPDSEDVEFACTGEISRASTPRTGHTMSGVYARNLANNLLTYSQDFDPSGWTAVGMSRDTVSALSSVVKGDVTVAPTAANSKHYFEQDVSLEAGETYLFSVSYCGSNSSGAYVWLSYEKPDTSEHGAGCICAGTTRVDLSGSTEVGWSVAGTAKRTLETGSSANGYFGAIFSIKIAADTTGTYKLRFHVTNGTDPNTAHAGDTNDAVIISGTSLVKGPSKNMMPIFLPTTATPIQPGDVPYALPVPPYLTPTLTQDKGYTNIIMRRSGGSRPLCKLFNQITRGVYSDFDDNTTGDTRVRASSEAEGPVAMRTSQVVYDLLADTKFYFELYVDTFGTGAANDCYVIGACPFEAANVLVPNGPASATGAYSGQFAYTATGKTYTNGVLDGGTVTGWSAGDYIGCGIDFANWEITFYRNGTLLKTMTIPAGGLREAFWVGLFGFFDSYSADKQAQFTYNFRGPFGGRKPTGFVAFDFDNELT